MKFFKVFVQLHSRLFLFGYRLLVVKDHVCTMCVFGFCLSFAFLSLYIRSFVLRFKENLLFLILLIFLVLRMSVFFSNATWRLYTFVQVLLSDDNEETNKTKYIQLVFFFCFHAIVKPALKQPYKQLGQRKYDLLRQVPIIQVNTLLKQTRSLTLKGRWLLNTGKFTQ